MRKFRFSIRTKVILLLAALLVIIFGIFTSIFVQNTVRSLRQSLTNEATSFAQLATEPIGKTFLIYKDSGTVRIDQQVAQFTNLDSAITNVAVYDLSGKVVYAQNKQGLPNVTADMASSFERQYIYGGGGQLMGVMQPFIEDNGIHKYGILYLISNDRIEDSIRDGILTIIGFVTLAVTAVGAALYLAMNQFLLKPVKRVSQTALLISAGQLDKEIPEGRQDEIGDLARSVNTMADSLKADITKLQEVDKLKSEFMTITSHNLRTPLTVINGYLDTMKMMQLPANVSKMINTIAANSTKLSNLAEDILTISELEAGRKVTGSAEEFDVVALCNEIAIKAKQLASERQLNFVFKEASSQVKIKAAKHHLQVAIWNLLDNAIKFTNPTGQVTLETGIVGDKAYVRVSDSGIGIAPDEIEKLFTKFHRGTDLMRYNYEGTGIGLYISRLMVKEFGGDISVASQQGKGSTFTITLPLLKRTS